MKCVVCGKISHNNVKKKFRVEFDDRANSLRKAANILLDDVYTRICDLETNERMFGADLYYHNSCFPSYIGKANRIKNSKTRTVDSCNFTKREIFKNYVYFIREVIDVGKGISISDIRDMINVDFCETDFKNNEIKPFLSEEFGDSIQFSKSEQKNMSTFVFSSSVSISDINNILRSTDNVKTAASEIRKALLEVDFGSDDKFCDDQELRDSWKKNTCSRYPFVIFCNLV